MTDLIQHPNGRSELATVQSPTPADLLRIAIDQKVDIDRLEKLMAMQERWEANKARQAYTAAMVAFKAEAPTILKKKLVGYATKDGGEVGYRHAELSDVCDALIPALAAHGFSHDWNPRQADGKVYVDCTLTHVLGHSKTVTMEGPPDNSGKKNVIQQSSSTVTYLERYALLAVCGMATKGMDDDGRGADDDGVDKEKETEWLTTIASTTTQEEFTKRKTDLIAAFGGSAKVPAALRTACVEKLSALKAAATPTAPAAPL